MGSKSVAPFKRLYVCSVYNAMGHRLYDKEVYSNNIMDGIKDITKPLQLDTLLSLKGYRSR